MPFRGTLRVLLTAVLAALTTAGLSLSPAYAAVPVGQDVIISGYASNWYLSTDFQTVAEGQRVQIWDRDPMANNGAGSVWRLSPRGDGSYSISPSEPYGSNPRFCLSNEKAPNSSGEGAVWVRRCNSSDSRQAWWISETSSRSYVHTIVPVNDTDYALGPYRGLPAADTYVNVTRQWGGTPSTVQMWKINPA
ncbi:RICIN domain-containing protein [Streptomyces sp. TP-A0874]|uniref:RICIN domain-containing protein n=1 Tax=Streptomyces sp. TP-A0874 TaxID=549819 RepID=UPI000852DCBA|nr:hypothetical protein [Streptomyces sp. TP-A0874]